VECTQFCVEKTSKQQLSEAWAASERSQRNTLLLLESKMAFFPECMLQCFKNCLTPPTCSETRYIAITAQASVLVER